MPVKSSNEQRLESLGIWYTRGFTLVINFCSQWCPWRESSFKSEASSHRSTLAGYMTSPADSLHNSSTSDIEASESNTASIVSPLAVSLLES